MVTSLSAEQAVKTYLEALELEIEAKKVKNIINLHTK